MKTVIWSNKQSIVFYRGNVLSAEDVKIRNNWGKTYDTDENTYANALSLNMCSLFFFLSYVAFFLGISREKRTIRVYSTVSCDDRYIVQATSSSSNSRLVSSNLWPCVLKCIAIKHKCFSDLSSRLLITGLDVTWLEMELLGVKFAPLRVPIERRLQTVAAAAWICILTAGGPAGYLVTAYILIFTQWLRYVMLLYLIWIYYDRDTCRRGGRGKAWTNWMRNCAWWRYYCSYFPIKLVKTTDLDPGRNYLFCAFPHGILSTGAFGAFATDILGFDELFPGIEPRLVTLDVHFHVPLFREFVYSFGTCSSSAESLNYLLADRKTSSVEIGSLEGEDVKSGGKAAVLIVGGAAESLKCKPGCYNIILRRRKGFVRIALKNGSPLVPVISFGETDLYNQITAPEGSMLNKAQQLFRKITGIAPVFPIGRGFFQYTFGVVPKRKPVTVVVGSPMEVPKIPEPTMEQIEEYHTMFKNKLIDFFETEKYNYIPDPEGISLTIE